jgi:hypothetical protein
MVAALSELEQLALELLQQEGEWNGSLSNSDELKLSVVLRISYNLGFCSKSKELSSKFR